MRAGPEATLWKDLAVAAAEFTRSEGSMPGPFRTGYALSDRDRDPRRIGEFRDMGEGGLTCSSKLGWLLLPAVLN